MAFWNKNKDLQKLSESNIKDISKKKPADIITMLPSMDREVAVKVLEQCPSIVNATVEIGANVLASNDKSVMSTHEALDCIISSLQNINLNELSHAEKLSITDKMIQVANIKKELDNNNKGFLSNTVKNIGYIACGALTIFAVVAGVKNKE